MQVQKIRESLYNKITFLFKELKFLIIAYLFTLSIKSWHVNFERIHISHINRISKGCLDAVYWPHTRICNCVDRFWSPCLFTATTSPFDRCVSCNTSAIKAIKETYYGDVFLTRVSARLLDISFGHFDRITRIKLIILE